MKYPAFVLAALLLSGCGRGYSNFSLPLLQSSQSPPSLQLDLRAEPVLRPTAEQRDALNPSVVRRGSLYNFYSTFDGGTWRTILATSDDGLNWGPSKPVLAPSQAWEGFYIAANGAALTVDGAFWYWYVAGPRDGGMIGLARSRAGENQLQKREDPVLRHGPFESWDERAVADPYVIRIGPYFYMYYLGQDRAVPTRQRIGVARSTDGIHWEKLIANPVLEAGKPGEFDEAQVGEPAVFEYRGFYWMLYTGSNYSEERSIGLARSVDGVHWTKQPLAITGRTAWNSKVLCDPTVIVERETIPVWFGGGDVASPDENLHGQIGYGVLRPTS